MLVTTGMFWIGVAFFVVVGFLLGGLIVGLVNRPAAPSKEPAPAKPAGLHIFREPTSGALRATFRGKALTQPDKLAPGEREEVKALLRGLQEWLTPANEPAEAPAQAPIKPEPVPVSQPRPVVPPVVIPAAPVKEAVPSRAKSIVEQIDEILQEKLARNPLPGKTVRLVDNLHQGVIVWVNGQKCEGIDCVTDAEVKALLQESVREWEKRAETKS